MGLDGDVTIGDSGERGGDAEVVYEPLPGAVVADGVVEVVFESACLVAPDGATGGAGGCRSENFEVELGGPVGELEYALDAGEVEGRCRAGRGRGSACDARWRCRRAHQLEPSVDG